MNINIREGLGEDIQLSWRGVNFTWRMDYENVLFRCIRCHVYGHPVADCSLGIHTINVDHIQRGNKGPLSTGRATEPLVSGYVEHEEVPVDACFPPSEVVLPAIEVPPSVESTETKVIPTSITSLLFLHP